MRQSPVGALDHSILPPPDGGVDHADVLVDVGAALLQSAHAVGAVVLEMADVGRHREGRADAAQAAQREVVVQDECSLGVVKALDVLPGLGVVGRAPHVLQHVQVRGDLGVQL